MKSMIREIINLISSNYQPNLIILDQTAIKIKLKKEYKRFFLNRAKY